MHTMKSIRQSTVFEGLAVLPPTGPLRYLSNVVSAGQVGGSWLPTRPPAKVRSVCRFFPTLLLKWMELQCSAQIRRSATYGFSKERNLGGGPIALSCIAGFNMCIGVAKPVQPSLSRTENVAA